MGWIYRVLCRLCSNELGLRDGQNYETGEREGKKIATRKILYELEQKGDLERLLGKAHFTRVVLDQLGDYEGQRLLDEYVKKFMIRVDKTKEKN